MTSRFVVSEKRYYIPHPFEPGGYRIWVLHYNDGTTETVSVRIKKDKDDEKMD